MALRSRQSGPAICARLAGLSRRGNTPRMWPTAGAQHRSRCAPRCHPHSPRQLLDMAAVANAVSAQRLSWMAWRDHCPRSPRQLRTVRGGCRCWCRGLISPQGAGLRAWVACTARCSRAETHVSTMSARSSRQRLVGHTCMACMPTLTPSPLPGGEGLSMQVDVFAWYALPRTCACCPRLPGAECARSVHALIGDHVPINAHPSSIPSSASTP